MRRTLCRLALAACAVFPAFALAACGGRTVVFRHGVTVSDTTTVQAPTQSGAGIPVVATKNTTRVDGADPISDAAAVALAVYPSAAPGTHPPAVILAPTNDWEAAIASSVLIAPPIRAPILLSDPGATTSVTAQTLQTLAPAGSGSLSGAQLIRVGSVPTVLGMRSLAIRGTDPFTLAAAINRVVNAVAGRASADVMIASADGPQYAMPAAGLAAESGSPILFVTGSTIPAPTKQALVSDARPHIFVLGPPSLIPDSVISQLRHFGTVNRIGAADPTANSVALAKYRDPPCTTGQPCAHVPGSFGWALESPGHGYVLINASRTLDAAAAAPLSSSGSFGAQLLITDPNTLPSSVATYFGNYATPGYTAEGPTAAVYNHGWVIGDQSAVSVSVQAEMDSLLEAVPVK
ncbi:MAG TPA: cell wall-binding repeat-containing protein [Solirubrobacteraceae bacterium]